MLCGYSPCRVAPADVCFVEDYSSTPTVLTTNREDVRFNIKCQELFTAMVTHSRSLELILYFPFLIKWSNHIVCLACHHEITHAGIWADIIVKGYYNGLSGGEETTDEIEAACNLSVFYRRTNSQLLLRTSELWANYTRFWARNVSKP